MSTRTVISIKIERDVRDKAKELARKLGLPLSTIISGKLRQFVYERGITFQEMPRMSKKLERIIAQAENDRKTGRNRSPVFDNMDEAIAWLNH